MSIVDPKDPTKPVYPDKVKQLADEIRALKTRINTLESQVVRAPGLEMLDALPEAAVRANHIHAYDSVGDPMMLVGMPGEDSAVQLQVDLASPAVGSGGALIYANDGASGSVFTTVAGFIAKCVSSAGASVVGFVQSGAGAVTRTSQDKMREYRSVMDFGAKADGNYATGAGTDNTANFQAALNSVSDSGGGAVYVPPGIYKLAGKITMPNAVMLIGAGKWQSILFAPTSFSDVHGLIYMPYVGGYASGVRGFGVIGQTGGCGGSGIVCEKNGSFISDVWVNGFIVGNGIYLGNTDVFLSDFVAEQNGYGVHIASPHVSVEFGTTHNNVIGGTLITRDGLNATQEGPVQVSNVRDNVPRQFGFYINGAKNVQLTQCSAFADNEANYNTGIAAAFAVNGGENIELVGCSARIAGGVPQPSSPAVSIYGSSLGVRVVGGKYSGFRDGIASSGGKRISVTGAEIGMNYRHGVFINGGDVVTVSENQIFDNGLNSAAPGNSGVYDNNTGSGALHLITGNFITQTAGITTQQFGIRGYIAGTGLTLLSSNIVKGNTTNIDKSGTTANFTDMVNVT
jgi:hypothetical protein